jgi:predicted Zn-dependent protease
MTSSPPRRRPVLASVALCIAACVIPAGCETNVATGKRQFVMLDRNAEIKMGLDAFPQMVQENGGELKNPELNAYVSEVGSKMAATTEGQNPSLPWKFTILDSDIINAFALPGGQVFISRGLMQQMTNEAQLAGVLGHEIGHVTARHINDRMVDTQWTSIGTTVAATVLTEGVGGTVGQVAPKVLEMGGQTLVLRFGRSQELEADALGMRYMSNVKYNPTGQRQVMEILEKSMGTAAGSEWFSTHPYPKTRIEQIDRLLATTYSSISADPSFQFKAQEYMSRARSKLALGYPTPLTPQYAASLASTHGTAHWCVHCSGH